MTPVPGVRRNAAVLGAVGFALAFLSLCLVVYARIFSDAGTPGESAPGTDSLPVPVGLAWSPRLTDFLGEIGRLPSAAVLGIEVALYCLAAYALVRVVNPTFRLTTGVDWDRTVLTRTYMHTQPVIKLYLIAVTAAVPGIALWAVWSGFLGDSTWSVVARLPLVGAAWWMLFSRDGVAGHLDYGNYEFPREPSIRWSLARRGLLAGAGAALAWVALPFPSADAAFAFYRSLGGIGEANWWRMVVLFAGGAGLAAFALGVLCAAMGRPGLSSEQRMRVARAPALALLVGALAGHWLVPRYLSARYDYRQPGQATAVSRLAERAGVAARSSGVTTTYLLDASRATPIVVQQQSVVGLDASPLAADRVEAFLTRAGYVTSLSTVAFEHLFDSAALTWDTDRLLRVCELNATRCPDSAYVGLMMERLTTCAASPGARRGADMLADARRFRYPDRSAREALGDIYARLGMREQARRCYVAGGVAATRVDDRLDERVMFADGHIEGRLLRSGKPMAGVRVGLMPRKALSEAVEMFLPNGTIRPFWFRSVSVMAITDASGRFSMDRLVAGRYGLIVSLPGRYPIRPVEVRSSGRDPGDLFVSYSTKSLDLGRIDLRPDDSPGRGARKVLSHP